MNDKEKIDYAQAGTDAQIKAEEKLHQMIFDASEGNPGALTVLMEMQKTGAYGWFCVLQYLTLHGPKGSNLWVLYKDIHKEDAKACLADILGRMKLINFTLDMSVLTK